MTTLNVSPPVAAILAALVEEHSGLHYSDPSETFIEKVSLRATEAGFDSLLDYYYFLRYDPESDDELNKLIDALVVSETYLFREYDQLRIVVDEFIAPMVRAGRRPRIWSAACATGEEPITLAMLLAGGDLLPAVELIASDISERNLARARSGVLGRRSLRQLSDPALVDRWIRREESDTLTVARELIEVIDWRCLNLKSPTQVASVGTCDVILCRNVLIYFSDATTVSVVNSFWHQLPPGGVLFVGVSESLLRLSTSFKCEEKDKVFYYRKVG